MAKEAERLLAGTGWLPELLRTPAAAEADGASQPKEDDVDGQTAALPAFLVRTNSQTDQVDLEGHAIAAE